MTDTRGLLDVIPDARSQISPIDLESSSSNTTSTLTSFRSKLPSLHQIKTKCIKCCSFTKEKFIENHQSYPHTTYTTIYYIIASLTTLILLCTYAYNPTTSQGAPQEISCRNYFWADSNSCGVDGARCTPFSSGLSPIRCPGRCSWYDPSLQIWGNNQDGYHGHSRICVAAVHSGVIPTTGGCALVHTTGSAKKYFSTLGKGGITSNYQNESFYKSFKLQAIDDYNCPGFNHHLSVLFVGYFLMVLSVLLPSNLVRPHVILLFAQPLIFGCFYLTMVNHTNLTNSGPKRLVSAIGSSTSVLLIIAAIYWYMKDRLLTMIDYNTYVQNYNENWNEMDEISNDGMSSQCCIGWKMRLQYIFLYVTPCFVGFHLSWFNNIEGFGITLSSQMFTHENTAVLVIKIFVVLCVIVYAIWIFIHLFKIAYKQNRALPILGTYGVYAAIMFTTRMALLPCYNVHLHHAWIAFVVLFGINFKSLPALILAGFLCGVFVDGITTWDETWFFNIWEAAKCPPPYHPPAPTPTPTPRPHPVPVPVLPHNFDPETGNLTAVDIFPNNITVSFPSAELLHEVYGIGVQSIKLVVNQMVRIQSLHSTAMRNGDCTRDMCTYTAMELYDGGSYVFQYFVLGSGERVRYKSPELNLFTPEL